MKKFIKLTLFLLFVSGILFNTSTSAKEKTYYYQKDKKIYLEAIDTLSMIEFRTKTTSKQKLEFAKKIFDKKMYEIFEKDVNSNIHFIPKKNQETKEIVRNEKSIKYINPVYKNEQNAIQIPSDRVCVEIKEGYNIKDVITKLSIKIQDIELLHSKIANNYIITLEDGNSIEVANTLYETGYFEYSEPDFYLIVELYNPLYGNQWGLENVGQSGATYGIDIKINPAWNISKGANVKVAVLDCGIDLTHPDLQGNLLSGYDATNTTATGTTIPGACYMNDYNYHGTACAGIIAAIDNGVGLIGVAPQSKIVPIRISHYLMGDIGINDTRGTSNIINVLRTAQGINYAWDTAKVDILSSSWGLSDRTPQEQSIINTAINAALTQGRDGKGCVVVFAVGNGDIKGISYPANSHSDIITVGAMSICGKRKDKKLSCSDGHPLWGSNYGVELDVVAPGIYVPTTDIQGNIGLNTNSGTNGNYILNFWGTSAAAPHVAGVAALMLSTNPYLTQKQVSEIIEKTAQKINQGYGQGQYNYTNTTGRPNGTWHEEMGYGLVNAYEAVKMAKECMYLPTTYTNPNITTNEVIYGNNLHIFNTKVKAGNKLTINSCESVTIDIDFEVEDGAEFEVNIISP